MDDLLKGLTGGGQGTGQSQQGAAAGGLGGLLGGLAGGGGLGSILSAGLGAGVGSQLGGGMGSILGGGLGAMLPSLLPAILGMLGGKAGADRSGMHQMVDTMHANGLGGVAQSWVGTGENQSISAADVQRVLTPEQLAELSAKSGLSPEQVSQGVAAVLPDVVNHLTPDGSLPDPAQVQGTTSQLQEALAGLTAGQQ